MRHKALSRRNLKRQNFCLVIHVMLKEILFERSPFPHLQPGRGHSHWETRRRWWRSLPQNSGSISSSRISGRPHQTFWKYRICGWWDSLLESYTKAMIFTRNYGTYWFNPCMILIRQTYPTKTMIKIVHKQMTQLKAVTWIMHTSNNHTLRYCVSHKNGFNGLTVDDKTHLKWRSLKVKWVSTIPVVFTLVLRTSCWVGI